MLALDIAPNDPKALFRRCQAYEQLEEYENAYKDAAMLMKIDPKNSAIQPVLRRLNPIIQKKVSSVSWMLKKISLYFSKRIFNLCNTDCVTWTPKAYPGLSLKFSEFLQSITIYLISIINVSFKVEQQSSTESKVKQMFDLAFSEKESEERRRQVIDP